MIRVAICAPAGTITHEDDEATRLVAQAFPELELHFHPQCFLMDGHFAGTDQDRLNAFLECANDPGFDAVWFARGGYGSNRIAQAAMARLDHNAHAKQYLGYSDMGYMLGALYREGIGQPVHAPMPGGVLSPGGTAGVARALGWLAGDPVGLEPNLDDRPTVAFNLMTLAMMCGTPLMPGLAGHVVMVEEVSEHLYAVDRLLFHLTSHLSGVAGIRLGRVSKVPENDRPFGATPIEIAKYWCERHSIPFLGEADIGHDAANRIVPFGLVRHPRG